MTDNIGYSWCLYCHVHVQRLASADVPPVDTGYRRGDGRISRAGMDDLDPKYRPGQRNDGARWSGDRVPVHASHTAHCWRMARKNCPRHVADAVCPAVRRHARLDYHGCRLQQQMVVEYYLLLAGRRIREWWYQRLNSIADLPQTSQQIIRDAGKEAVMWSFIAIMPIMGISFVTGLFLGNVWIKSPKKSDLEDKKTTRESEVMYVPYLYAVFKVCLDTVAILSRLRVSWP